MSIEQQLSDAINAQNQLTQMVANRWSAGTVPPGCIAFFARDTAPTGWLKCDGAVVSRVTYADLFAAINTNFGAGTGATTFNLPDLRGEFLRAWDDGRGVDRGRVLGAWQRDDYQSHTHKASVPKKTGNSNVDENFAARGGCDVSVTPINFMTEASGGNETRPRNIALLACIKY